MARILLSGGAYQSRSLIAGAQRCVNLYTEANPADSNPPVPVTHYPTPGLRVLTDPAEISVVRCIYTATNGDLYVVTGNRVEFVDESLTRVFVGTLPGDRRTPVSMVDNGDVLVLVDGSAAGWAVDLTTRAFAQINDPAFLGADFVEYLDTYFIFNQPGTGIFYISLSNVSFGNLTGGTISPGMTYAAFDPTDLSRKTGSPDDIAAIRVIKGDLWITGTQRGSEVWRFTGAADFPLDRQQGAQIEHGCAAKYSLAAQDVSVFWLSKDKEGQGVIVQGAGYQLQRISTHAIEAAIQAYARIDDAIGYCFQQQGHAFYVITFPTADATWAYELKTKQWHELAYTDSNGQFHRHRANCCAFAYGQNIVGDWQNGNLYVLDPEVFTDFGQPIVRLRTFPHMVVDGRRASYDRFIVDMEVGTLSDEAGASDFTFDFSDDFGFFVDLDARVAISLRWSDTRGASYGNPVMRSLGRAGEYLTSIMWPRLGMARDRVFEVSWSAPMKTALNGAFVYAQVAET